MVPNGLTGLEWDTSYWKARPQSQGANNDFTDLRVLVYSRRLGKLTFKSEPQVRVVGRIKDAIY